MNSIKRIRERLMITQAGLAEGIDCTQANVGHYEQGQTVPPDRARRIIAFAKTKGLELTLDDVYAIDTDLPENQVNPLPPISEQATPAGWDGVEHRNPLAKGVPPELERRGTSGKAV